MTESTGDRDSERLDLRALDIAVSSAREDATMQAVLARITPRSIQPEWWVWMSRAQRGLAAAAVIFVLLAGAAILSGRDTDTGGDVTALIEAWVASGEVPSNGELLTAYKGYRQ